MRCDKTTLVLSFQGGPWDGGLVSLESSRDDCIVPESLWVSHSWHIIQGWRFFACGPSSIHSHPIQGTRYRCVRRHDGPLGTVGFYRACLGK